jgi:molecular chaperone GrpE
MPSQTEIEFASYRARARRERETAAKRARHDLIIDLVSLVDDLNRGVETTQDEALVNMRDQIKQRFVDLGYTPYTVEGDPFDPELHMAIDAVESDQQLENHILECHRLGWKDAEGVVVREATVTVVKTFIGDAETKQMLEARARKQSLQQDAEKALRADLDHLPDLDKEKGLKSDDPQIKEDPVTEKTESEPEKKSAKVEIEVSDLEEKSEAKNEIDTESIVEEELEKIDPKKQLGLNPVQADPDNPPGPDYICPVGFPGCQGDCYFCKEAHA